MAQNLQLLKRRIKTAKNISQIAKAMEMMSASKIKRAQNAVENNKPYSEKISNLTNRIIKNVNADEFSHPYINGNQSESKILIAISPDKGLCGSLNTNLFRKLLNMDTKNTYLITIGKKVERFSLKLNLAPVATFPMGTSLPEYSIVNQIVRIVNEYYSTKKVSKVEILFTEFKSIFSQEPTQSQLLPIQDIQMNEEYSSLPYKFEPNINYLLSELLPHYLEVKLFNAIIQAYTSEQAARMVAMQNAKNNALDIADSLSLTYNKSRQERITNEILDLTNTQGA